MAKWLGMVLLVAGSVAAGRCGVKTLKEREETLREMIIGLEVIMRELSDRLIPLSELLYQAASRLHGNSADFFTSCGDGIEHPDGRSFQKIWITSLKSDRLRLKESDLAILEPLGSVLGRYDGAQQRRALERTISNLDVVYRETVEHSRQYGKLYTVLGLTGGAFLLIMLI